VEAEQSEHAWRDRSAKERLGSGPFIVILHDKVIYMCTWSPDGVLYNRFEKEVLEVSVRAIFEWKSKWSETENLERVPFKRKVKAQDHEKLAKSVEEHPDAALRDMASELNGGMSCIGKVLRKLQITG
jgi:hypothetical protein